MRNAPTFYLTSTEASPTLDPRKCWVVESLWSDERKDYLLRLHIEPPIAGATIGKRQEVMDEVVIATRYKNTSLSPLSKLPVTVFVCLITDNQINNTGLVSSKNLQILLIGEIYMTMEEAEKAIRHEIKRF